MKYTRLALFALCALAVPLIGLWSDHYIFVSSFPYGGYYHSVSVFGTWATNCMLVVGAAGGLLGLIAPKISIWFGPKTRKNVLVVYGGVLVVAFTVRSETHLLSQYIYVDEQATLLKTFEQLQPGMTTKAVVAQVKKTHKNIAFHYGDTSPYVEVGGFPFQETKPAIIFKFPTFYPKNEVQGQLVFVMSAVPSNPEAVSERVVALEGKTILAARPTVTPGEAKIYRGHVVSGTEFDTFVPCGSQQRFELQVSDSRYARAGTSKFDEWTFVVFRGALASKEVTLKNPRNVGVLNILEISKRGSRHNYRGDILMDTNAEGVEAPWDCVWD